jgi:hypothetical protein
MNAWSLATNFPHVGQNGLVCENYVGYYSSMNELVTLAVSC